VQKLAKSDTDAAIAVFLISIGYGRKCNILHGWPKTAQKLASRKVCGAYSGDLRRATIGTAFALSSRMDLEVKLKIPCCGRIVTGAPLYSHAVAICKRTCPKCRSQWQAKIKPIRAFKGGWMHLVEWILLPNPSNSEREKNAES
jgi:hypothetical protein